MTDFSMRNIQAQQCVTIDECKSVEQMARVVSGVLEAERRSHLDAVDRLERALGVSPRTAELRAIGMKALRRKP